MAIVLPPVVTTVELEALVAPTMTTEAATVPPETTSTKTSASEATEPSADFDDVGFGVALGDSWSCEGRHGSVCWCVDAGSHGDCGCDNEDHFLKHCL